MLETLREVKRLRPKALWGLSPYPACYSGEPSQTTLANSSGQCPAAEMALNDELVWLWTRCSALYPLLTLEKVQVGQATLRIPPYHIYRLKHLVFRRIKAEREKESAQLCRSWIREGAKEEREDESEGRVRGEPRSAPLKSSVLIFYRAAAQELGFTCPIKSKKPSECPL